MSKNIFNQPLPITFPKSQDGVFLTTTKKLSFLPNWLFWTAITVILFTLHWKLDTITNITAHMATVVFGAFGFDIPTSMTEGLSRRSLREIASWRSFLYYISLVPLLWIGFKPTWDFFKKRTSDLQCITALTLLAYAFLFLLVIPVKLSYPFLYESMGYVYSYITYNPFEYEFTPYYKRLFIPSLAYIFQLKGFLLFFVFYTSLLIACIASFVYAFKTFCPFIFQPNVKKTFRQFSLLIFFSFLTSAFFLANFQQYGYLDFIFIGIAMILMVIPQTKESFLALTTLCLCNHEISLFVLFPIAICAYPKDWGIKACIIFALYCFFWFASFNFDITAFRESSYVMEKTTMEWLLESPIIILLGTFFSFKLWWIVFLAVVIYLVRINAWPMLTLILFSTFIPYSTLFVAVDSTRMAGNAFLGFTLVTLIALRHTYKNRSWMGLLTFLAIINLFIPSVFVGPNVGIRTFSGVYYYAEWLLRLF